MKGVKKEENKNFNPCDDCEYKVLQKHGRCTVLMCFYRILGIGARALSQIEFHNYIERENEKLLKRCKEREDMYRNSQTKTE